jgi:hypothetical protein
LILRKAKQKNEAPRSRPLWGVYRGRFVPALKAVAALVALYLFVLLYLEPPARYYGSAPVFFLRTDFLAQHLAWPGGALAYVAAFLAQMDYNAKLGAVSFTALAGMVSLFTRLILGRSAQAFGWEWSIPGLLLVMLYAQYTPPVVEFACGLLLAMGGVLLWWQRVLRTGPWRWLNYLAIAGFVGYVGGFLPGVLLAIIAGLSEWISRRDPRPAIGCWLVIPVWGVLAALDTPRVLPASYWHWADPRSLILAVLLYVSVPLLILLDGVVLPRLARRRAPPTPTRHASHKPSEDEDSPNIWVWVRRATLAATATVLFLATFDSNRRSALIINAASERNDWAGVLAAAAPLKALPTRARLQVNRALFHTGRLMSDLFAFPQRSGVDLLASLLDGPEPCLALSDTLLELGQANLAEHYAQEAVETYGEHPEMLWRLASINLVKERPKAARVFLNVLRSVPFHRDEAARWLISLEREPSGGALETIAELRAVRTRSDVVEREFPTEMILRQLLAANRQNRMAAEYLVAHYLLTHQTEQAVKALQLIGRTDYRDTPPRHLAEAMLVYNHAHAESPVYWHELDADLETKQRFALFRGEITRAKGHPPGTFSRLAREFQDTYWYYDAFGRNAGDTKAFLERQSP